MDSIPLWLPAGIAEQRHRQGVRRQEEAEPGYLVTCSYAASSEQETICWCSSSRMATVCTAFTGPVPFIPQGEVTVPPPLFYPLCLPITTRCLSQAHISVCGPFLKVSATERLRCINTLLHIVGYITFTRVPSSRTYLNGPGT